MLQLCKGTTPGLISEMCLKHLKYWRNHTMRGNHSNKSYHIYTQKIVQWGFNSRNINPGCINIRRGLLNEDPSVPLSS